MKHCVLLLLLTFVACTPEEEPPISATRSELPADWTSNADSTEWRSPRYYHGDGTYSQDVCRWDGGWECTQEIVADSDTLDPEEREP